MSGEINDEVVVDITKFLLSKTDEYVQEHDAVQISDMFMGVHNYHKFMIKQLAERLEAAGKPQEQTFRMADMAFRNAMRQLRRDLPIIESPVRSKLPRPLEEASP